MKRKLFLETFLSAFGVLKIIWGNIHADKVYGTAIYDETDPEEKQDFVWHITEENVPSENVRKLINYLNDNHLINGDKIVTPVKDIDLVFFDKVVKDKMIEDLFSIEVKMLDNGEETDSYFFHN